MPRTKKRTVAVGVFDTREQAQKAVDELRRERFRESQIGVASKNADIKNLSGEADGDDTYADEGALTGALAGAGVGGLWGIGIAAGLLPAIGPVIAGGTLAAILASAATGAAVASLVGALVGMGIPEEEAEYYESQFNAGKTIVTVKATTRYDKAAEILRRYGGCDISDRVTTQDKASESIATHKAGNTVELHEEHLHPHKTSRKTGEVKVAKEVITERKTIDVPVTREEVVIERRPVHRRGSAKIDAGEEIRIPVSEEKVHVEKEAVVNEEVHVGKRRVTETQTVGGDVRKERLRIKEEGDVDVHDRSTSRRHRR